MSYDQLPELADVAQLIGDNSPLVATARQAKKRPDNILGLLLRDLTREEIAIMEGRGCRADDWQQVRVAEDFDPFRVRRTHFIGSCCLGRFDGDIEVRPGMRLPTGVYGCTLENTQVGNNCLLENVRFALNAIIEPGAVCFDVGSIYGREGATFGCASSMAVGPEVGGLEIPRWAEARIPDLASAALDRSPEQQATLQSAMESYLETIADGHCWIRRGAIVRHTILVEAAWIGPGCTVDQATEVVDLALLGTADEPVVIAEGALVRESILQSGVRVAGGAIVRESVLLSHALVDSHAVVEQAAIGPNSHIAKGEVTASLVGPFVGLHHQSLLIGAIWPEGKGNIAYGAMVGSNHTGRAPDQEIWCGEGTFFGLGVNIKFPTDFSRAAYSIVGSGVATLAQRVTFPFSLIATPIEYLADDAAVPRAYNEILPGWGLYANAYAVVRMEEKFENRDKTNDKAIPYHVLRPKIIGYVRAALKALEAVTEVRDIYLEKDIPGLGKNFMRETVRQKAMEAYRTALLRYSLRVILAEQEGHDQLPGSREIAYQLADEYMPGIDLRQRLLSLINIERENVAIVSRSKISDDARGARIIPGYDETHKHLDEDAVVQAAKTRLETTEARVQALLA